MKPGTPVKSLLGLALIILGMVGIKYEIHYSLIIVIIGCITLILSVE